MAKIIVVTSGKGGVGKTTTSASFSAGLANRGFKTVVIDFDVGLRNLDLIMGCENRIVYDFVDVITGNAKLTQALVKDKQLENLYILPASQTRDKDALTDEGVAAVMKELNELGFDYIVCDSPAGIERGAQLAMYHADEALIVTNPEISSVRDSDRVIGLLQSRTKKAEEGSSVREHLIVTRYNPERAAQGEMMDLDTIANEILRVPLIGVIPESNAVLEASNHGQPVIHYPESAAGQCYDDIVARFLGEERPLRHLDVKKKGFFQRLFGG
ncbi:septum site-determining protein MinD [Moraxella caviae]|uniref:Septum site-determining protein MinD n=1 Tax=Moraxella caviae TaxID=34060 RepID=A0A1T0ACU6_9GAMM|nr:septum site-determining protein MinD [Moraxella caviae]OOR93510.1 septum site-determining protein MinD [Moraxella caviae]STZ10346.1 Cell division inhibitor MinD [Moraxella caviae]VEW14200.1 Cell division inhibitor MinD [Moraxella caviae]